MIKASVLFLVYLLSGCHGNHLYDEIHSDYEELVKLQHVNGDGRLRRDTSDFPDNLEYSFTLKDTVKSLHLKRNSVMRDYVPLTVRHGNTNKRLTGYEDELAKSAYYLDEDSGAAVFLHCHDYNEACSMYGSFHDEGVHHVIQPSKKEGFHQIKRSTAGKLNMDDDTSEPIDLLEIQNTMKYRPQHAYQGVKGVVQHHTVEVSFFLDDSCYSFFMEKYYGNSVLAMKWLLIYYVQMANEMHMRYRSVQKTYPYLRIDILLNEVIVALSLDDSPWVIGNLRSPTEVYALKSLDDFAAWQYANKEDYLQYDHAAYITRRHVTRRDGSHYVGQSFFDGVCANPTLAASISNDNFEGVLGKILAHELGHNLGAYHDGTLGCDDEESLTMNKFFVNPSRKNSFNSWFFSVCSVQAFFYFLDRKVGYPKCTMQTLLGEDALVDQLKTPATGETYSLDEQCQFAYGLDSLMKGDDDNNDEKICGEGIRCTQKDSDKTLELYVFQHTKCGPGKWCDIGRCIDMPEDVQNPW